MTTKARANQTKFRWAAAPGTARTGYLWRNPIFLAGLAAVAVLLVAGFWIHNATDQALRDRFREALITVAATNTAGLHFWVENELSNAHHWADLPSVLKAAKQLMAVDSDDLARDLLNVPVQADLLASLQTLVDSDNYDGFGLVSREGIVLASSIKRQVGRRLTADGFNAFSPVLDGEPTLSRPYHRGELLEGFKLRLDQPVIAAIAPVHDEHDKVIAAFFLMIDPEKDFTRILSIARLGKTGDTYAFNRDGLMLSDSRHDEQLKAIGLIPDTPEARSILRVHLRDPGGDMTSGYRPDTPLADRPLTKLVADAVDGDAAAGLILDAYRDYRGVEVVGAYRWLPKYGIGLATEVSVDAARSVTRPVQLMVYGLLGLLLVSSLLIFISSYALQFLRRRVEQVKQLGQYTLERKIGSGGMGEVYLARHALLRRPTAVKFIRAGQVSEENLEHFEREVQSSSLLTHPNTIEIYDYGRTDEGVFYYVMEYLPGLTLADLMELEDALPPSRAIYILSQICASLREAHARGFVHRDVKPLNIILTERGGRFDFVKVLDFGLVREVSASGADSTDHTAHELAGTPPYIAPERLKDPSCMDPRSDIFSVGVIAFNLVTGKQPFEGNTPMEIAYHCANTPAPRPSEVAVQVIPPELDQLIVDCMAIDPEQRPVSTLTILARLEGAIAIAERWDQKAARSWWAGNAKRVGTAGHEVAVSAAQADKQVAGDVPAGLVI